MKTIKQLAEEIDSMASAAYADSDITEQVQALLTDFVKEIETEVINGYELESWEEWFSGTKDYGGTPEEYVKLIAIQQRSKLQQILKDQKEEV